MPRREQPLDSDGDALTQFALGLRALREKAGSPTYRELARRAHYAPGTLSDAAGGRKLPTLGVTLAYVRACQGDVGEWEKAWHDLAAELSRESAPNSPELAEDAPYVGLSAFRVDDAYRFFGRERVLDELDVKLARSPFLAVFGPSGAGKSSLLRAGFVPRRAGRVVVLFSPGSHPFEECALELAPLARTTATRILHELKAGPDNLRLLLRQVGGDRTAVVVVDQFEELFTMCVDPTERAAFLDALMAAASGPAEVVIGVRADFYPRCAEHRGLAEAVAESQVLLGPMSTSELRNAIVKPAAQAGLVVEGALATELVAEAHAEPGVLPLLSHALLETWRRRRGTTLALSGYHATGGIRGALANTAEAEYSAIAEDERPIAEQLFLRLIDLGEGSGPTKRRVSRDELGDDPRVGAVLDRLAAARLITLDAAAVELTHEALIGAWPRLRDWLAENRAGLQVHRQLTAAAAAWEEMDREPDALVRGTRLAIAREWAETGRRSMTSRERQFLEASLTAETAQRQRTERWTRLLRWLAAGLTVLLVVAVGMAWEAHRSQVTATEQQQLALSRQLAAQAEATVREDTGQTIRLSLEAVGAAETAEARSSLLSAAGRPAIHGLLPARVPLALSKDGARLASVEQNGIAVWDVPRRERVALLAAPPEANGPGGSATTAAFDDGRNRFVTASSSGRLDVWDLRTSKHAAGAMAGERIRSLAFSRDGSRIIAIDGHQGLSVWDATTLGLVSRVAADSGVESASSLALSPDGGSLLTTSGYDRAVLRDAVAGTPLAEFPGSALGKRPLAVDPTGSRLAIPAGPNDVKIWSAETHSFVAQLPGTGEVDSLAFLDRRTLVVASLSSGIAIWDVDQQRSVRLSSEGTDTVWAGAGTVVAASRTATRVWELAKLPLVTRNDGDAVAFADGDRSLLVAGRTGLNGATVQKWHLSERTHDDLVTSARATNSTYSFAYGGSRLAELDEERLTIRNLAGDAAPVALPLPGSSLPSVSAFSPDGSRLAVGYLSGAKRTVIWDIAGRRAIAELPVPARHLAYSPDGRHVAIDDGNRLAIWDSTTRSADLELAHGSEPLGALAYSPDGQLLAIAHGNARIEVWSVAENRHIVDLAELTAPAGLLAFSPDGRFLAAGGDDKLVVWQTGDWNRWATLVGSSSEISGGAWNGRSDVLATAAADGTVSLWPIDVGQATDRLCAVLARDFPASAYPSPAVCSDERSP
ncbi:nSTAND1 domain-containing NTPase [Amycolatopsis silviterrae]|uniref:HTH cro/C1-type domain-containing protein n=1 Tax=Amycolatopsis silviterrae TaxID=1656914 RepID=A0ABW5H884_9PSEU